MARGQAIGQMVFNKPQLIALDQLQPIINYLSAPDRATTLQLGKSEEEEPQLELRDFRSDDDYERYRLERIGINPDTMVGTLDISGSLMYRKGSMGANCRELTSYEGLKLQTQSMIDEGVESIVLMVDSGGGMAYGMFAAADYIKKITKEAGVKTTAYVDGVSYSAAYGLSVLADEIVVNPQASVGSVGVVVALYNDSKMLEKAGVTRQFVYAGENKIPFDATGEFTDTFIEDLQKSVDKTYGSFTRHIATNRNLPEQAIIDTQASVYDAEEALELGLVDKIMDLEDFEIEYGLKYSSDYSGSNRTQANNQESGDLGMSVKDASAAKDKGLATANPEDDKGTENMTVTLQGQLSELQGQFQELNTKYEDVTTKLTASESLVKELQDGISKKELEDRTANRKARLEAAMGKDNEAVETMLLSTDALAEADFSNVVLGLAGSQADKAEMLNEIGGEGDTSEVQLDLSQQLKQMAASMNSNRKA